MLQLVYIILTLINLILILVTAKKFNFLIVYYFSSVIYYFNAFFGEIYSKKGSILQSSPINEGTYYVLIINMIVILIVYTISLLLNTKKQIDVKDEIEIRSENVDEKSKNVQRYVVFIGTIINIIALIYCVFSMRNLLFSNDFDKVAIMSNTSRIEEYYKMFTMFWFLYLVIQYENVKSKIVWIVSILSLGFTFLLGHRSFIVIVIIAAAVHILNEKMWKKGNMLSFILKNKKIMAAGILLLFLVFFVKGVYAALLNRDWDLVFSRLTNISYYTDTLKISEPNVIISNLDGIVSADYELDKSSYLILPTYIIPGLTNWIGVESFTYKYQENLFGTNNRASTILGEAYANGKLPVVFIVCVMLTIILIIFYKAYRKNSNIIWKTFFLISGIDIAFFVHRNSADYAICRVRYYFYFVIVLFIIKIIANTWIKKVNKYEE